jgi:hypothetical protein
MPVSKHHKALIVGVSRKTEAEIKTIHDWYYAVNGEKLTKSDVIRWAVEEIATKIRQRR